MFGRNKQGARSTDDDRRDVAVARGGVSFGAIITGVVVAIGAMTILTAVIAAVLTALGVTDENVTQGELIDGGIAAGIGLVVAMFLAYLWGGYTAGRMARGKGPINGFLVPVVAIILLLIVAGIGAAAGASADVNANLPFNLNNLPLEDNEAQTWGIGLGIAALIAMFLGAILGGSLGHGWHRKLERRAIGREEEAAEERRREAAVQAQEHPRDTRLEEAREEAAEKRETERTDTGLRDRSATEAQRTTAEQQTDRTRR